MRQNYQISEQFPSPEEEEALEFPVFLLQKYLILISHDALCPLLLRNEDGQILAFWVFLDEETCWRSPIAAPFSCPQVFDPMDFNEFLSQSCLYLKDKKNKPVRFIYNSLFSKFDGFSFSKTLKVELNQFISIEDESFTKILPQKRRRQKLRSLKRKSYVVSEIGINSWEKVYQKNLHWRIEKGHQNFIPLNKMVQFKSTFPHNYIGFELSYSGKLLGSAFLVHIKNDYLYLYSLIVNPEYDKDEPSLLLYEAIHTFAKSQQVNVLDLGTSMALNGAINKNIANYKKDIGGLAVRKYTFEC